MEKTRLDLEAFLNTAFKHGLYSTDDIIDIVKPLFEEVVSFHDDEKVAPFEWTDKIFITDDRLDIDENFAHLPKQNLAALKEILENAPSFSSFDIVGTSTIETDVEAGKESVKDMRFHLDKEKNITHPVYLKGYQCYEFQFQHHDELSDIFCLGLVLASVALGLNLSEEDDLLFFGNYLNGQSQLNPNLHPAIHSLIREMTELDRHKRSQNLYDIIQRLENYRDFDPELNVDLSQIKGLRQKDADSRNAMILKKLRNRLFDNSRRNRLLYYKPNMRFVNFTITSVPMVINLRSIQPEHLFTWNKTVAAAITSGRELVLNKYLRFDDHPYLAASLDRIRSEARRDKQEYGFSQLKLAVAFLNWSNLKEDPDERINSPLLLVPVELVKTKKVREDVYTLKILENVAEVNPVISNFLRDQFNIVLPDSVELDQMEMHQFYELMRRQIETAGQGVQLHYIDKPRIKVIHSIARNTVNVFNRKLKKSKNRLSSYLDLDYAYESENWKPLGYEIFKNKVEPHASTLEFLIGDEQSAKSQNLTGEPVKSMDLYELASSSNPLHWEFDVCNIILANFNYKKMSLVRDYNEVIDKPVNNPVFESLFKDAPREIGQELLKQTANKTDLNDCYHVIGADPTQSHAVNKNLSGASYVIQGPPGTGKSQTISNLIADYVARGKRVLFICEKRAALDVVFHRLKQQGLDELCCYIHDSQADKKQFVLDLKLNYEKFLKQNQRIEEVVRQRDKILAEFNEAIKFLETYHSMQNASPEVIRIPIFQFIERLSGLDLSSVDVALLAGVNDVPDYAAWIEHQPVIRDFFDRLERYSGAECFGDHPFSRIQESVFLEEEPVKRLREFIPVIQNTLNAIVGALQPLINGVKFEISFQKLLALFPVAEELQFLVSTGNIDLIGQGSKAFDDLQRENEFFQIKRSELADLEKENIQWRNKFSLPDTRIAMDLAVGQEGKFFNFLNGAWRRLRSSVKQNYNFAAHPVKPKLSILLQQLLSEYQVREEFLRLELAFKSKYHIEQPEKLVSAVDSLRSAENVANVTFFMERSDSDALISSYNVASKDLVSLGLALPVILRLNTETTLGEIEDLVENIGSNYEPLSHLLPALRNLISLPVNLKEIIVANPLSMDQVESVIGFSSLRKIYASEPEFEHIDFARIDMYIHRIQELYKTLLHLNSDVIRTKVRKNFQQNLEKSALSVTQLDAAGRTFKKRYAEGRKILENEFTKVMRFRSIRDLTATDSEVVIRDLKYIWLMSPLSVSDSIALNTSLFDVVIFDEASQITLEEGIPSLFRAPQAIIVGDDKQMPPSNFFNAKSEDPDDFDSGFFDEDDELLNRDSDSLLTQGSRKLDSVMLGWHYRSRRETLIGFSNFAFYGAGLLTIPDKVCHDETRQPIRIEDVNAAIIDVDDMLQRSISFHRLPNAIYEKRTNVDEAIYISKLVTKLLKSDKKETIGIVAFSKEQQNCIEDALTQMASEDKELEKLLELAYNRTEDDQFVGLFIKNLENVQGDERDIIIMSICYGFDTKRKMIMNFGPINKKGGEKRLNVIFSRAKKHMAVVSSIDHHNITNEYNDGANYFKKFLHYAELVSNGDVVTASSVLGSMIADKNPELIRTGRPHAVVHAIKAMLEKKGYHVTSPVGQSIFKCSLGVKINVQDYEYTLGILVDDEGYYANQNVLEQYCQRPEILKQFGWRLVRVFSKDWISHPNQVMDHIIQHLLGDEKEKTTTAEQYASIYKDELHEKGDLNQQTGIGDIYSHIVFRRLVLVNEKSNKYWEAGTDGNKLVVHWGKIATKGQYQVKTFAFEYMATAEMEKLIQEKLQGGYVEPKIEM